jgi:ribosomal-protein-alanine N-acetyltransferase
MENSMETTAGMTLRKTESSDSDSLFNIFKDEDVVRYTNFRKQDDVSSVKIFLDRFLQIEKDQPLQYGPYSIVMDQTIIGLCGVQQKDLPAGVSELWYILDKNYWGKGLAAKAVELLLEQCKSNPLQKSVYAEAVNINKASWRILERAGFQKIKEVISGFKKGDMVEDLRCYSYNLM